jgi:hypothetical protein
MKAMKLPKELESFLDVAETAEEDRESLALSTNPRFLSIIETARKEVRAGKTISLAALERKFGLAAPNQSVAPNRDHHSEREGPARPNPQ